LQYEEAIAALLVSALENECDALLRRLLVRFEAPALGKYRAARPPAHGGGGLARSAATPEAERLALRALSEADPEVHPGA
jgi:hypothetical protein